jgi:cell shape-determining protein MreC
MNYLLRDNKKKNKSNIIKYFLIIFILFLVYFFFSDSLKGLASSSQRLVGHIFGYYNETTRPISENSLVQMLRSENQELKDLLGRKTDLSPNDVIFSVVLMRPPKTSYDSLLIDIGEDHGLVMGDRVYAENEYLIGQVEEVRHNTSVIKLFSTPGEKIDVLIGTGSSTASVIAEGMGAGNFYIKAPKNISIQESDPIVVHGIYSYILGSAEKIESSEGEAFNHIHFKLPIKLNSLKYVQVKKGNR